MVQMRRDEYRRMFEAENRLWWYLAMRKRVLGRVAAIARAIYCARTKPIRLLDAGCGTGGNLASLSEYVDVPYLAVGLEVSKDALELATARVPAEVRLLGGTVEALPFADQSFDIIFSADVLYHEGVADDVRALSEFRRCLRPGGAAVLNLPAFQWLRSRHDEAIGTARRYTTSGLRRKMEAAGLRAVSLQYWNSVLFPAMALYRLATKALPASPQPASDVSLPPEPFNKLLGSVLDLELRLPPLPFGLSVLGVAQRG